MTYIVIEIQKNNDGTIGTLVYSFADRNAAEQQYHTILAAAAVSALPCHAATMLTEMGTIVKSEYYTHEIVPESIEPEAEPEDGAE